MGKTVTGKRICAACRITVLSRYNADPLCAPCARTARESSGIMPVWVWDSAELRSALARTDLAGFVAAVRRSSGLSLLALGALVEEGWSEPHGRCRCESVAGQQGSERRNSVMRSSRSVRACRAAFGTET